MLYNRTAINDLGTMASSRVRIHRNKISENVKSNFDPNSDFAISFFNAHIAVAVLNFFGMENSTSRPTVRVPPPMMSNDERLEWTKTQMKEFVSTFVTNDMAAYIASAGKQHFFSYFSAMNL